MSQESFNQSLTKTLDQLLDLVRQDLVTLRNDVVILKVENEGTKRELGILKEINQGKTHLIIGVGAALITAFGAIIVSVVQLFRK